MEITVRNKTNVTKMNIVERVVSVSILAISHLLGDSATARQDGGDQKSNPSKAPISPPETAIGTPAACPHHAIIDWPVGSQR